ncbi:MAG: hypothetical protein JWP96_681 [Polaromonas sp.]|nr:hypothetical protein [Polaromonas sp.]
MKKYTLRVVASRLPVILAMGGFAVAMQASAVQAPPRPPGSDQVVVEAGVNPEEVTRQKRAHNHSKLAKKDHTRDDTRDVLLDPKGPKKPKDKDKTPKSE